MNKEEFKLSFIKQARDETSALRHLWPQINRGEEFVIPYECSEFELDIFVEWRVGVNYNGVRVLFRDYEPGKFIHNPKVLDISDNNQLRRKRYVCETLNVIDDKVRFGLAELEIIQEDYIFKIAHIDHFKNESMFLNATTEEFELGDYETFEEFFEHLERTKEAAHSYYILNREETVLIDLNAAPSVGQPSPLRAKFLQTVLEIGCFSENRPLTIKELFEIIRYMFSH